MRIPITLFLFFALVGTASSANYDEGIDGELSGDRFNPTFWDLDPGSNSLRAAVVAGDLDYFTITLEEGEFLTNIFLTDYPISNASFIAIQEGTTFTEPPQPPGNPNVANLLGWTLVNTPLGDIMPDLANSDVFGAMGFDIPLGPGDYTFWYQQTAGIQTPATFSFMVQQNVPVPTMSEWAVIILGLIILNASVVSLYNLKLSAAV